MALSFEEKKRIVGRINSRIRTVVKKLGTDNRAYNKFALRVNATPSLSKRTSTSYADNYVLAQQGNYLLDEEGERVTSEVGYKTLSSAKADIEAMSEEDLLRLEKTTKTWSEVRQDYIMADESGEVKSVDEMRREMQMKHYTSQVLEAHSDMWYILLEETGWSQTEAQEKSPEEIYRALTTQRAIETPEGQFFDFTIADLADNDKDFQYRVYKGSQQVRQEMGRDMQAERERLRDHLRGLGIGM